MPQPSLSIVIPVWNQLEYTRACIASLRSNTDVDYELIIIDNGSETEHAAAVQQLADTFIGNETNLGFATAMNQGLEAAGGDYVAFVNNDTVFPESWASRLVETFDSHQDAGIVMPAVTAAGNQASVRDEPHDRIAVFPPFTAIPSGVVYLTERETMRELGGWNQRYGIASAEDLDLLFTFWANDRSVVLDERVLVEHASAVTASTLSNRQALYSKNRRAFATRWASADPGDCPQLSSCPDERFAENLAKARVAGTWMQKWFAAMDLADGHARAVRNAQARPGDTESAPRFLDRIRRRLRRT